jgi:hypothetical protein
MKPTIAEPKLKYAEVKILPHHIMFMDSTVQNGALNITNSIWLAAFAAYNVENKLHLSPANAIAYQKVLTFIKQKIG